MLKKPTSWFKPEKAGVETPLPPPPPGSTPLNKFSLVRSGTYTSHQYHHTYRTREIWHHISGPGGTDKNRHTCVGVHGGGLGPRQGSCQATPDPGNKRSTLDIKESTVYHTPGSTIPLTLHNQYCDKCKFTIVCEREKYCVWLL